MAASDIESEFSSNPIPAKPGNGSIDRINQQLGPMRQSALVRQQKKPPVWQTPIPPSGQWSRGAGLSGLISNWTLNVYVRTCFDLVILSRPLHMLFFLRCARIVRLGGSPPVQH